MKVGDYVRTKNLGIFKIDEFCSDIEYDYIRNDKKGILINKKEIVKSSPSIIDLIEVGDYVNKSRVVAIDDDGFIEIEIGYDLEQGELLPQEDIKSIVTKEAFESIEYKLGE